MLDFTASQKNDALADRFTEMFRTQNKKKAAKALFMGVSPLMLAACGGGSGTTEVRVNGDENSAEATRLSLVDQFNSKVAYSDIPGLRVFTEGTLVPVASDRDFSLMEIRASGDFNGDGLDDILYAHSDTLAVPKILTSNGDGTFGGNVEIFGHQ